MAEVIPGVAVLAVVFAHGPPLAFAQVGAPFPPRSFRVLGFFETRSFVVHIDWQVELKRRPRPPGRSRGRGRRKWKGGVPMGVQRRNDGRGAEGMEGIGLGAAMGG